MKDCHDCERSRLGAKEAGHRNWRTGVCYEHAAFDLNSPRGRELMADVTEDDVRKACKQMGITYVGPDGPLPEQPDLFGAPA